MRCFLAVFLVMGCGGKDDEGELPPPITLESAAAATEVSAQLDAGTQALLEAENAISMFLDLLISDNTVKSTFWIDGELGIAPVEALDPCWSVPTPGVAGFEYDVDLGGCSTEGFAGIINVENTAAGPVIMTFSNTTVLDWTLTGTIAFDYTSAGDGTWHVYSSDASGAAAPLSVAPKSGSLSLTIDGGMQVGATGDAYDWWGSWTDGTSTIGIGAAAGVAATDTKPATWLDYDFMPAECACQQSGDVVVTDGVTLTEISVDLDDLETTDDGVDDPPILFASSAAVAGGAALGRGETCGSFDANVVGEADVELTFTEAELKAGFQAACDLNAINDEGKCTRLQEAAVGATVTITVPPRFVNQALTAWTEDFIDEGLCFSGMVETP